MKFNHRSFIFASALSVAFMFSACGESTNSDNTADDDDFVVVKSSSSAKKKTSSSSSADVKDADDPSDLKESKTLEAPKGVKVERLAPSIWDLGFEYDGENAENFVVQRIAPGAKSWEEFDQIDAELTHYLIDGDDKGGYYYRIAAKNKDARSSYTAEVFVSEEVEYVDGIDLTPPTAKPNVFEENVLELVLTGNYPGKKITKSAYNKGAKDDVEAGVFYEARFVTGTEKQIDIVKVSADQLSISKEFDNVDDQCNAYAQIRVVWTDKNGVSDYGEWSDAMGTKAGTNSLLVDAEGRCEGKTTDDDDDESTEEVKEKLATPTDLRLGAQGLGVWMIEWSFEPNEKRPEKGFKIQKLDLEKSEWEDYDASGAGVYRAKIEGLTDPYNYFRVAAFDKEGSSEYSKDVLIAVTAQEVETMAPVAPDNLQLQRIAPSVWELSWTYDIASDNDSREFLIQSSKLKDFEWNDVDVVKGNVRYYHIQGLDKIELYYRIAVIDNGDTSAFTPATQLTPDVQYRADMQIPPLTTSHKLTTYFTMQYETDGDTATKEDITYLEFFGDYTMNNFITKYVKESEYTKSVSYEAHWFNSVEYYNDYKLNCEGKKTANGCDSCFWDESFPYESPNIGKRVSIYDYFDKDAEKTVMKQCQEQFNYNSSDHHKIYAADTDDAERQTLMKIESNVSNCYHAYLREFCGYMVQFRIVWEDIYGVIDHSEWSEVYNLSSMEGADVICSPDK